MLTKTKLLSTAVFAIGLMPFAAAAAPIQSEATITVATGEAGDATPAVSTTTSIVDLVATPGATAEVGSDAFGSFAQQKANGESEVIAFSEGGGGSDFEMVTSEALLTQAETNTSGGTLEYFLDFSLEGLSADLLHVRDQLDRFFEGGPVIALRSLPAVGTVLDAVNPFGDSASDIIGSAVTAVSFEYFIEVNGDLLFSTRADGMVSFAGGIEIEDSSFLAAGANGSTSPVFGDTADLTGTFGPNGGFEFTVDDLSGSFILGQFADGESVTVVSGVKARAYSHDGTEFVFGGGEECFFEIDFSEEFCDPDIFINGVDSFFSDPVVISSIGSRVVPTGPSAVPLPAGAVLLLTALGAGAFLRRKKA